jgi:rRNA-processing protein FCF1
LLVSIKIKLDLFEEIKLKILRSIEFIILSSVIEELNILENKNKYTRDIQLIKQLLKKRRYRTLFDTNYKRNYEKTPVDNLLIKVAKKINGVIATADESLKHEARRVQIPVISLRGNRIYYNPPDSEFWRR